MLKLIDNKILTILHSTFLVSKPVLIYDEHSAAKAYNEKKGEILRPKNKLFLLG